MGNCARLQASALPLAGTGQLFGVPGANLTTVVAVPLVLVIVAVLPCWVPARRAARLDPAVTLSAE